MFNHLTESMSAIPEKNDLLSGECIFLRQGVGLHACHHPGEKPALVFLHGGLGNRFNWRFQYEYFFQQGQEVLAYDLGGHGQSTEYDDYSIGRHRRDLNRLLHLFKIEQPILCCHSYGVPIGLEWVRRHPVKGLVLVAGGTHDLAPWWEIPLMKFLKWGGRHLYHLPGIQSLSSILTSSQTGETLKQFFSESPNPTHLEPYEALEIFWGYNFFRRHPSKRVLDTPVLVITGGKDPMFTKPMGDALANCFQHGEHFHLPNAGHLIIAEYADLVNAKIHQWLKSL